MLYMAHYRRRGVEDEARNRPPPPVSTQRTRKKIARPTCTSRASGLLAVENKKNGPVQNAEREQSMAALQPTEFESDKFTFASSHEHMRDHFPEPPPPLPIINTLPSTLLALRAPTKRGAKNALHVHESPLHMEQG